jgi:hypothetical protein
LSQKRAQQLIFTPQLFDLLIEFYGVRFGALRIPECEKRERRYQRKNGNRPRPCKGSHFHARDSMGKPHRQQAIKMQRVRPFSLTGQPR